MKKNKSFAKINDVFLHVDEKKMFMVVDSGKFAKGSLYTLKEIGPKSEVNFKRYYEDKLKDNCVKVKNAKAAKILYGKK